jgi:hypothetical protein
VGALSVRGRSVQGAAFTPVGSAEDARGAKSNKSLAQKTTLAYSGATDQLYALTAEARGATRLSIWSAATGWVRSARQPEGIREPVAMMLAPGRDFVTLRGDSPVLLSVSPGDFRRY